ADAVHPGYGFLAESALLARTCAGAGVTFVGPDAAALERLGHKQAALALARAHEVSTLTGTTGPTSVTEAEAFLADHGAMVIKAVAGGGGRGLRVVRPGADVAGAHERCRSEAVAAFGDGEVYVERYLERARHVEVQLVGDGSEVLSVGDRECTLQRRHQKLVEVAPSPAIDGTTRAELFRAAERLATAVGYRGIGTFEFLVDADDPTCFWFIEANARLQVEHTVTEETTGLDLVQIQLLLAAGATLTDLGLGGGAPTPRGAAIEVRVNAETITPEGNARPSIGTITELALPAGPGVRCDTAAHTGLTIDPGFDSMLVKLVARAGDHPSAHRRIRRALDELRVDGVTTNRGFLSALLDHDEVAAGSITTSFVADHLAELVEVAARNEATTGRATARSASDDAGADRRPDPVEPGTTAVEAPLLGTVVSVDVAEGDLVAEGGQLLVIESMKMEHVVSAPFGALVRRVTVSRGDPVAEGQPVVHLEPADVEDTSTANIDEVDPDHIRPDLAEVLDRHEITNDRHRPDKVARRHE
ncbi:MAG: biotin/lipoyl-containing protein, partial [Acidimicrobiales bacterium]